MISRNPKLIGFGRIISVHISKLCEPAISGITAVVSADSAVRNAAVSSELANAAASQQPHWPLSQLVLVILGTSRNCVIRRYNKSIHSKHFITEKRSEKVSAAAICRVQHCDVTILCSA